MVKYLYTMGINGYIATNWNFQVVYLVCLSHQFGAVVGRTWRATQGIDLDGQVQVQFFRDGFDVAEFGRFFRRFWW